MIKHGHEQTNKPNPIRIQLLNQWRSRWKTDGLSVTMTLSDLEWPFFQNLDYEVVDRVNEVYYTNITVDVKYENKTERRRRSVDNRRKIIMTTSNQIIFDWLSSADWYCTHFKENKISFKNMRFSTKSIKLFGRYSRLSI